MRTRLQFFALLAVLGHLVWLFGGVSAAPVAVSASESENFVGNYSQHGKRSGSSRPQIETTPEDQFVSNLVKHREEPLASERTAAHALDSTTFVHDGSHVGKDATSSPSPIQMTREKHVSRYEKREAAAKKKEKKKKKKKKKKNGSKNDKEREKNDKEIEKQQEEEDRRIAASLPDTDHKAPTPEQTEALSLLQKEFIGRNLTASDEQFISGLPPHQQKGVIDRIVELRLAKALSWLTDAEKNAILIEIPDGLEEKLFLERFPMFANPSSAIGSTRELSPRALALWNRIHGMVADDEFFLKHKGSQGKHPRWPDSMKPSNIIVAKFKATQAVHLPTAHPTLLSANAINHPCALWR
ncbi:hypothetical protein BC567DRAFT_210487 [Phyllosticta citribraziliensis]